jgi:hypothetical protein
MDFLLEGLAFHAKLIRQEQAKGAAADDAVIAASYAAGREYAKDAAPYRGGYPDTRPFEPNAALLPMILNRPPSSLATHWPQWD